MLLYCRHEDGARSKGRPRATDRSKSCLAACAVEEYVAVQEWQVRAIREGLEAAEQGETADHGEALKERKRRGRRSHAW